MQLAVLTTSYPRSVQDDAGVFVARLVSAFEELPLQGVVIVPRDGDENFSSHDCFRVERFSYTLFAPRALAFGAGIVPNIRRNPLVILQIPGLLFGFLAALTKNRRLCDFVFANWLVTVIPGAIYSLLTTTPVVVTVRGEDLRLIRSRPLRMLLIPFLSWVKKIVVVSSAVGDEFAELLPKFRDRIVVIENGVEPPLVTSEERERIRTEFKLENTSKVLLFVGSVIPRKRVLELIDVVSTALKQGFTLVICGRLADGVYANACRKKAKDLGVEERVLFLGAVAPTDVWGLLSLTTVYVSASEFEGRPNSLLEALASGIPAFVSDIPSHRTLVTEGENGRLFEMSGGAQEALLQMLYDSEKLVGMGRNARARVKDASWKNTAIRYRELFELVAKGH